jgi:hypothetical protein
MSQDHHGLKLPVGSEEDYFGGVGWASGTVGGVVAGVVGGVIVVAAAGVGLAGLAPRASIHLAISGDSSAG